MQRRRPIGKFFLVQTTVVAAFAVSYAVMPVESSNRLHEAINAQIDFPAVKIERQQPLVIEPLYDDPEVVSDEELAAVLKQVRPRFGSKQIKPNFVEHALRTWRIDATFEDPDVISGADMRDFLVDHGKYLASWGGEMDALLQDRPGGVAIRWGVEEGASVHHDHWLACLTEAGVSLDEQVYTPARRDLTFDDVLQEALRDLRLDGTETEWSAMSFGMWLPPTKTWKTTDGRDLSFDLLAKRLLRGHKRFGVCSGTHRVYSLMSLIRLDDEYQILSKPVRDKVYAHLESVRDLIKVSQFEDGRWPGNWSAGAAAVKKPIDEPPYKQVIATGHHLEWLAIAPKDLHPPREMILKAADWIIKVTTEKTESEILQHYTFYSHVGNALALWRKTRPPDAWRAWRKTHPYTPEEAELRRKQNEEKKSTATDSDAKPGAH